MSYILLRSYVATFHSSYSLFYFDELFFPPYILFIIALVLSMLYFLDSISCMLLLFL
jgi:hypothetical protein